MVLWFKDFQLNPLSILTKPRTFLSLIQIYTKSDKRCHPDTTVCVFMLTSLDERYNILYPQRVSHLSQCHFQYDVDTQALLGSKIMSLTRVVIQHMHRKRAP